MEKPILSARERAAQSELARRQTPIAPARITPIFRVRDYLFEQQTTLEMLEQAYHLARIGFQRAPDAMFLCPIRFSSFGGVKFNGVKVQMSQSVRENAVQCMIVEQVEDDDGVYLAF